MGSIRDAIVELEEMLNEMNDDAAKFDRGNKTAGVRVRKGLSDVAKSCKEIRNNIQEIKESREG